MDNELLQEIKKITNHCRERGYIFVQQLEVEQVNELIADLEAAQQRLAEADVRITKLKSFLYSLRDVTTVAGAQIRRIDKIVDEAVDENSK